MPKRRYSFCAVCGGAKEPNENYVHDECLAKTKAKTGSRKKG